MNFQVIAVLAIVFSLIMLLYTDYIRPKMAFLLSAMSMVFVGVLTVDELLLGFSNKQILIIFLLMILTTGLQQQLGNGLFSKIFSNGLSSSIFRLRMMVLVAGLSSFLNNTPVVAFMMPYVKSWSNDNGFVASKFLIPLSFATILGGMITMVGTSTNLVLNGLIVQSGHASLHFTDFLFLGLLLSLFGITYLYFFSDKLLPSNEDTKKQFIENIQNYLVETVVEEHSEIIGKSIEEAGLRHLKDLFLVEIHRQGHVLSVVDPDQQIFENDKLFFAGNPNAILRLINEKNGLKLPESTHVFQNGFLDLTEAIIPSGSDLIGESLKSCGFRDKYKASVISIFRKGKKVAGNLGEIYFDAGDLLLLLSKQVTNRGANSKSLLYIEKRGKVVGNQSWRTILPVVLALIFLVIGITNFIDLFLAVSISIFILVWSKILTLVQIRNAVDIDLGMILVSSLAIGLGISKSGTADYLIAKLFDFTSYYPLWINLSILFFATLLLTSLITNVATVSIMFPFAFSMAEMLSAEALPFFVTIAFAASADFITPIGYQTNLMVMGPGNYRFKDYTIIGMPLTLIYSITVLLFINYYYF
ncbi:MAG: SLC13 family permease [Algoriphagus sp.]|uniref:SLC13 family permease n=1 Tax=Algoriphagus sp. TaxID=1872435 RepID=UPI00262E1CFB|nr:SLC13 family permease [Algoriphagus sp.]MDG1278226.1 SLC13 family permease [Algoriphagus sp.]